MFLRTVHVPSATIGRNPAPLDLRKHRRNATRCVCMSDNGDPLNGIFIVASC